MVSATKTTETILLRSMKHEHSVLLCLMQFPVHGRLSPVNDPGRSHFASRFEGKEYALEQYQLATIGYLSITSRWPKPSREGSAQDGCQMAWWYFWVRLNDPRRAQSMCQRPLQHQRSRWTVQSRWSLVDRQTSCRRMLESRESIVRPYCTHNVTNMSLSPSIPKSCLQLRERS